MRIPVGGIGEAIGTLAEARADLAKLKKATTALEGFMFKSLLQAMGGKDGLFSAKVPGGQIYKDMFEQSMSETLAERGALGIGNQIYEKVAPMAIQAARARFLEAKKQAASPNENRA